jgi:hypothetical protein
MSPTDTAEDDTLNPIQATFSIIVAIFVGRILQLAGWPWYASIPAAILAAFAGAAVYVLIWATIRRLTYPYVARKQREHLKSQYRERAERDETQ